MYARDRLAATIDRVGVPCAYLRRRYYFAREGSCLVDRVDGRDGVVRRQWCLRCYILAEWRRRQTRSKLIRARTYLVVLASKARLYTYINNFVCKSKTKTCRQTHTERIESIRTQSELGNYLLLIRTRDT